MIAGLTGEVVGARPPHIVLRVNDISYLIAVTNARNYLQGSSVSLHTHLAVRENALDLYGFETRDDLMMFEQLIKLPKIGPKTALLILSQANIEIIKKAVRTDDAVYLSKMSGVGRKSAEKIVLGLKDVLGDMVSGTQSTSQNEKDADVIDALIALGYSQRDAIQAIQKIPPEIIETNARVSYALRTIAH